MANSNFELFNSNDEDTLPKFIAIEGCIGVGKSSLTQRLAESLGAQTLCEQPQENPFLSKFYQNPKDNALATQLFFLLQRAEQMAQFKEQDLFNQRHIADFLIDKDSLFAKVNLNNDEFNLYQQVYNSLTIETPKPDLVIYLQASIDVLMNRIQQRGRNYEQRIDRRYLEYLNKAYSEYFYYYDASPLLIINVAEIDFVNNEDDYQQLLRYILSAKSGRHYFNPTIFTKTPFTKPSVSR